MGHGHGYCGDGHGHGWGLKFMGRHRGVGRGFGPFIAGLMGDPGMGGRGRGWGRRVGAGDLQLVVLHLISQRPRHGYEIIKAIEEMSYGFYAPSPGVIYPALTYLEELGYASVTAEGTKKLYAITPEGQAYLDENRGALDQMFEQVAWVARKMSKLRQAFGGGAAEPDEHVSPRNGPLAEVWHELRERTTKAIVEGGAQAEQRVIEVLKRALNELKT